MLDLFDDSVMERPVKPWRPQPLQHDQWPPNYKGVYAWRIKKLEWLQRDPTALRSAKLYYSTRPAEFIQDWMDTYDPRRNGSKWVPFVFFAKQYEFLEFLQELDRDNENGLVEKCRDIGATWLCCAYSVWTMLFIEDDATGWGSRKQELVDKLGDYSSIFEKIRTLLNRLPAIWRPEGYNHKKHATFMKVMNVEKGGVITGESGDNIGRGGRNKRYFKDESAHYERPEKIEAALGDNTNVQIDISSVNGPGNVFHRKREAGEIWTPGCKIIPGKVRVFIFDWSDHPEKTPEWYAARKFKAEREGMTHIFAQEVDRNYYSALQNNIIKQEWVEAAVDAHLIIPYLRGPVPDTWVAGFDVADEGLDTNAMATRQDIVLRAAKEFGGRDTGESTREVLGECSLLRSVDVMYDCIGVGAGAKSEYNRLVDTGVVDRTKIRFYPWNAGAKVHEPYNRVIPDDDESPMNDDIYDNMKAQAWFSLRSRFYKVWRVIQSIKAGGPIEVYNREELISIDSNIPILQTVKKELSQPTSGRSQRTLKTLVNKTPEGTKSPNVGDAVMMAYFPILEDTELMLGNYTG